MNGLVQFDRVVEGTNRPRVHRPRLQVGKIVRETPRAAEAKSWGQGGRGTYGHNEVEEVDTREPGHDLEENVAAKSLQRHRHLVADCGVGRAHGSDMVGLILGIHDIYTAHSRIPSVTWSRHIPPSDCGIALVPVVSTESVTLVTASC